MKQGVGWHWVRLSGPDSPYQGDALFGEIKCNTNYSLTFFFTDAFPFSFSVLCSDLCSRISPAGQICLELWELGKLPSGADD